MRALDLISATLGGGLRLAKSSHLNRTRRPIGARHGNTSLVRYESCWCSLLLVRLSWSCSRRA